MKRTLSPSYSVGNIEPGADWYLFEGSCPSSFDPSTPGNSLFSSKLGSDLSGNLNISTAGTYNFHVIQVDSLGNYQDSAGDVVCSSESVTVRNPATLTATFSNPDTFLTGVTGDPALGEIASNVPYPTFAIDNVEADATVKVYAALDGTAACGGLEVYSATLGDGAHAITIDTALAGSDFENKKTTFSVKQIGKSEYGAQESSCFVINQPYMFDTGITPAAPLVALKPGSRNPSSSPSFTLEITPTFSGSASDYKIYIYDADPGLGVASTDTDFTTHSNLISTLSPTASGAIVEETIDISAVTTDLSISSNTVTNPAPSFFIYLKQNTPPLV